MIYGFLINLKALSRKIKGIFLFLHILCYNSLMTWAHKRQILYFLILLLILGGIAFYFSWPYFNKPPTCADRKQNGTESGVDCGGSCTLQCSFEVDKITNIWTRSFEVVPGRYNAVAYLENNNVDTVVYKIKYKFRFADKDNLYIGKREGSTFIPAGGKFAIFEPAVDLGNSIPVYTTFEFTEAPVWVKVPADKMDQLKVFVSDINLINEDSTPKLLAKIKNNSQFIIPEVSIVAILYDSDGNAVSASRTYVDPLFGDEVKDIIFTWPQSFGKKVISKEIIPMYNVFLAKLK